MEQRVIGIEKGNIWYGGMLREIGGGRAMDVVYVSDQGGRGRGGEGIWCCDGCTVTFGEILWFNGKRLSCMMHLINYTCTLELAIGYIYKFLHVCC